MSVETLVMMLRPAAAAWLEGATSPAPECFTRDLYLALLEDRRSGDGLEGAPVADDLHLVRAGSAMEAAPKRKVRI